jgi:uncharacterized protein (TIGR02145 family)
LPGGDRYAAGSFDYEYLGSSCWWWTASEYEVSNGAYYRDMGTGHERVDEYNASKGYGFSVRCVQDQD